MNYFGPNQFSNDGLGNNTAIVAHTASSLKSPPSHCSVPSDQQSKQLFKSCVTLCPPILLSDSVPALPGDFVLCNNNNNNLAYNTYRYPSFLSATACMGAFQGQKYKKGK